LKKCASNCRAQLEARFELSLSSAGEKKAGGTKNRKILRQILAFMLRDNIGAA
jgi:hypothetical protein